MLLGLKGETPLEIFTNHNTNRNTLLETDNTVVTSKMARLLHSKITTKTTPLKRVTVVKCMQSYHKKSQNISNNRPKLEGKMQASKHKQLQI